MRWVALVLAVVAVVQYTEAQETAAVLAGLPTCAVRIGDGASAAMRTN